MVLKTCRFDPAKALFVHGEWGYYPIVDYPFTRMLGQESDKTVVHYALNVEKTIVYESEDAETALQPLIRRIPILVYQYLEIYDQRLLTPDEFRMLIFLDFPDISEQELAHFLHTADYHDIELVPEKRDLLRVTARLSQA